MSIEACVGARVYAPHVVRARDTGRVQIGMLDEIEMTPDTTDVPVRPGAAGSCRRSRACGPCQP